MAKGIIKLSASNNAVVVILNKEFRDIQNIQITSNRSVIGEVREVNCMVKTKTETLDVKVWVHRRADGNYRKLFVFKLKEGVMSTPNASINLDPTRIEYRTDEDALNFAAQNVKFCERVNSGEKFYFMADRHDSGYGVNERVNLEFSFFSFEDGTIIPTPVFLEAMVMENDRDGLHLFEDHPYLGGIYSKFTNLFGNQFQTKLVPENWMLVRVMGKNVFEVGSIDLKNANPDHVENFPKFNPNGYDQDHVSVNPNDLIAQILLGMPLERYDATFLIRDEYSMEVLKQTVSEANFVGGTIRRLCGGYPQDLSLLRSLMKLSENSKQTRLLETWYQAMLIYKREGFWPLIRAKSNQQPFWHLGAAGFKMFKPRTSNSAWHEDEPDTDEYLALSRAIRNGPVASRYWEKSWPNNRGTDLAIIQVWADPKSDFTYANWHRDQAGHVVSGDVETYKRHFGIKKLAAEVNPGSTGQDGGFKSVELLKNSPLDLEDGGEY